MQRLRQRLTYANVVATLALFAVVAGGTAWALQRNSVRSKHIVNDAVKFRDLSGVKAWSKRVPVTGSAPNSGDALAAAKRVKLAKLGTITLFGVCYRNTTTDFVYAQTKIKTSANGAMMRSGAGPPVRINKTGPAQWPALPGASGAAANSIDLSDREFDSTTIIAGHHKKVIKVLSHAGTKNGSPPGGNQPFGAGDRCSFGGYMVG